MIDFSFFVQLFAGGPLQFQGGVAEFNPVTNRVVGGIQFLSPVTPFSFTADATYHQMTVSTGGLDLIAGSTYVAFLTTSSSPQVPSSSLFGGTALAPVPTNKAVVINSSNSIAQVASNVWTDIPATFQFHANFAIPSAPEIDPGQIALPFALLLGACLILWDRRPVGYLRGLD